MNENTDRVIELLGQAQELSPEARAAFLAALGVTEPALGAEVESLLAAREQAGENFLNAPSTGRGAAPDLSGQRMGPYLLLRHVAAGGLGEVYLAEQQEPVRRRVALKFIKLGMDTQAVMSRFEAERQALAMMDHPHIARVFDAGTTDKGRPYFVMEFIEGVAITQYCSVHQLDTRQRLELFIAVCNAVQHAHQKGIIHRDLKPSNILVTVVDGKPVVKIIDFGIAKAIGEDRLGVRLTVTGQGQFIGTPAYASPEQASSGAQDIDTRSDIYSLGVLLYELLTDQTPFDAKELLAAGFDAMRRIIREVEPPKPSTRLTPGLGSFQPATRIPKSEIESDLDWIVMKALEKDRARRYATANDFAADIQRHLGDEPVLARPPSNLYRLQKMVRRNKPAFAAAAAVLLTLLAGIIATSWQASRARQAERAARLAERAARAQATRADQMAQFNRDILSSVTPEQARGRDTTLMQELLSKASRRADEELARQPEVEAQVRLTLADTNWRLGQYALARTNAERARTLCQRLYGLSHTNTLLAQHLLGAIQLDSNELPQAETIAHETLDARRTLLGPAAPDTARSMQLLASIYTKQGRLTEAEPLLRQAIEALQQALGADDPDLGRAMNGLGVVHYLRKDFAQAQIWFQRVLDVQQRTLGANHPATLAVLNNLAGVYFAQEKLPDAERMTRQLVAIERAVHGLRHRATLRAQANLANALHEQGKEDEAEPLIRKALKLQREELPAGDPDILRSLRILAGICERQGKAEELASLLQEIQRLRNPAANPAPSSPTPPKPDGSPANPSPAPKPAAALPETPRRAVATTSPRSLALVSTNFVGRLDPDRLYREGKFGEAVPGYREAVALLTAQLGPEHDTVLAQRASLARCLADWAWDEHTNGVAAHDASPSPGGEGRGEGGPSSKSKTNQSLVTSAATTPLARAREAEQILRDVLAIRERDSSGPPWRTADVSNRLGFVLVVLAVTDPALTQTQRVAQLKVAKKWIDQSGYAIQQNKEINVSYRRDVITRFIRLYEAWDAVNAGTSEGAAAAIQWREALAILDRKAAAKKAIVPAPNDPPPTP